MADVKKINDGGPAFPVELQFNNGIPAGGVQTSSYSGWATGMSLREWYAGKALSNPAICTGNAPEYELRAWFGGRGGISRAEIVSRQAFDFADAMISARKAGA